MIIKNYKKIKCINNCELFNDNSNFNYWENKKATDDEIEILSYLNKKNLSKLNILHVGIGSSYLALNLNPYYNLDGISISNNEILFAKKKNIKNYNCIFLNKYSLEAFNNIKSETYDLIIDVNLKSYACCDDAFKNMFYKYNRILNKDGIILSGKKGMYWSRMLKPVYRFSLNKFFYKRLKEYDGPKKNRLTISECKNLADLHGLKFDEINKTNIVKFTKL